MTSRADKRRFSFGAPTTKGWPVFGPDGKRVVEFDQAAYNAEADAAWEADPEKAFRTYGLPCWCGNYGVSHAEDECPHDGDESAEERARGWYAMLQAEARAVPQPTSGAAVIETTVFKCEGCRATVGHGMRRCPRCAELAKPLVVNRVFSPTTP